MKNIISRWKSGTGKTRKTDRTGEARKTDETGKVRIVLTLLKYLLPFLLVIICYTKKHSESYLAFQIMELAIIILLSECISNRIVRRTVNTVLLLFFNVQLFVMIFGTTYVSWVMISNLSSLEDISGHGVTYIGAVILLVVNLLLPVYTIGDLIQTQKRKQQDDLKWKLLTIVLALEVIMTMLIGSGFSPLFNAFLTAKDGYNVLSKARVYANADVDRGEYYHKNVEDYVEKPDDLVDRPNVILIFTEGLSQNVIEDERNITPNIKEYKAKSLNFTNYYNHTFATYRGLEGQLYSGYSWEDNDTNNLVSIQDIFKDYGYHTTFINTEPKNYQFVRYLESFGFDNLVSDINKAGASEIAESISDKDAYEELWDVVLEESKSGQPFFTTIYTFGTHMSLDSVDEVYDDGSDSLMNRFYNMDYQFGQFMEKFEESDLADNTIVIFTADHCTYQDADFVNTFPDYSRTSIECDEIPLFIYYKGIEPSEQDAGNVTSITFAPTILDYLDMSGENYFMGNSLYADIWNKSDFDSIFAESVNIFETMHGIEPVSDVELEMINDKLEGYYTLSQQHMD